MLLTFMMFSCTMEVKTILVRAIFEHSYGSPLGIQVFVESTEGYSLDAARVIVKTPSGMTQLLRYNGTRAYYEGTIQSPEGGVYTIFAESKAIQNGMQLSVPCNIIAGTPDIFDIQDSGGKSSLKGEKLNHSKDISISWNTIQNTTTYIVRVYQNAALVFVKVLKDQAVLIPADTLNAGTYYVSVEAQSIAGDPLLGDKPYYTLSSGTGSSFVCTLE